MHDPSDDKAAARTQELHDIIERDKYPFSPRIRMLRAILAKPEPVREPLPLPKVYAPLLPVAARRRRRG
jgi:hypothetical protein